MEPPKTVTRAPWERNLKAREYTAKEWEQHHNTFKELYFIKDLGLAEVRQILAAQYGFYATEVQYKKRITKWGLEKNIKKDDMSWMVTKQRKRKIDDGKETQFIWKERDVPDEKLERFQKRYKRPVLAPSPEQVFSPAPTPAYIDYSTPIAGGPNTPTHVDTPRDAPTPQQPYINSPPGTTDDAIWGESDLHDEVDIATLSIDIASPAFFYPSLTSTARNVIQKEGHPLRATRQITPYLNLEHEPASATMDDSFHSGFDSNTRDASSQPTGLDRLMADFAPYSSGVLVQQSLENEGNDRDEKDRAEKPGSTAWGEWENGSKTGWQDSLHFRIRLGHNPLAIKLASAYIDLSGMSKEEYMSLFNKHLQNVLDHRQIPGCDIILVGNTPYAIAAFEMSFVAMQLENSAAAELLLACGYLHHENIYYDLIWRGRGLDPDDITLKNSIDFARSYLFIGEIPTGDGFSIAPALHAWLRERSNPDQNVRNKRMTDTLRLVERFLLFAKCNGNVAQRVLPHLRLCLGYVENGIKWGLRSQNFLKCMNKLAFTSLNQRKLQEAEILLVEVLALTKEMQGKNHPDTLESMANLGATYYNQGRYLEAETLYVEALRLRKEVLGENHPDSLRSMANLGITYYRQGRYLEAETLYLEALWLREEVLGENHPDTLRSMANLGVTYSKQGRYLEPSKLDVELSRVKQNILA